MNAGSEGGQLLDPLAAAPEVDFAELCSVTSPTPSIRRSRLSVRATSDWLLAQPVSVNVGTLPGGVAETAVAPPAEDFDAPVPLAAVGLPAAPVAPLPAPVALPAAPVAPLPAATAPLIELIEAPAGRTRPSSWKACAQSKRESTSTDTARSRSSRSAVKFV